MIMRDSPPPPSRRNLGGCGAVDSRCFCFMDGRKKKYDGEGFCLFDLIRIGSLICFVVLPTTVMIQLIIILFFFVMRRKKKKNPRKENPYQPQPQPPPSPK